MVEIHKSMYKFLAKITISLIVMGTSVTSLEAGDGPSLFRAVYQADYKGIPVKAKGIRELSIDENGVYRLTSIATSFFVSINEASTFKVDKQKIIPIEYEYHRSGIGKNRDAVLKFDWKKMTVLNNVQAKPWKMKINEGSLDKLVYQLQMREDLLLARSKGLPWPLLHYEIADGGKLKKYEFEVMGEEVIETPIGKINTLKIVRVKHRKNRETAFWLAPEYEFLLVRLQQLEGNGRGFELLLKEAKFDGKQI